MTTEEIEEIVEGGQPVAREVVRAISATGHVSSLSLQQEGELVRIESVGFYPIPLEGPTHITSSHS